MEDDPAAPGAPPSLAAGAHVFTCPDFDDAGESQEGELLVVYRQWGGSGASGDAGEPLILIHGSPGSSADFSKMGPILGEQGGRVLAPDLPGFGESTRQPSSYSARAHARVVFAMMDRLGIPRAHVLGWSMGGAVVLNMADIAPDRVASVIMLAASGDQSVEGSGSHLFEHAKYRVGLAALRFGRDATPHFGLLPDPRGAIAYCTLRNFDDTDLRPLRAVMERLQTPTLIIAGRDDFLVPLRAPELHHRLIAPSRLVVMDAMHFMPFLQAEKTSRLVEEFIGARTTGGEAFERSESWEAPARTPAFGALGRFGAEVLRGAAWWTVAASLALFAAWRRFAAAAIVAALVNALCVDWGVGLFGIYAGVVGSHMRNLSLGVRGRTAGRVAGVSRVDWARRFERSPPGFWLAWRAVFRPDIADQAPRATGWMAGPLGIVLYLVGTLTAAAAWTLLTCLPLFLLAALWASPLREWLGWAGVLLSLLLLWLWARNFALLFTWTGRRMLLARLTRVKRHEYWPPLIFYAPLGPYLAWLGIRHGHPLAFTACNPGVPRGGGVIGESKSEILALVGEPNGFVLDTVLIEEGASPEERAGLAATYIGEGRTVGAFPVILKPDAGLRGFAVRVVRNEAQLEAYFREMTRPAMLQRYHPGPCEVGVMWARDLEGRAENGGRGGMIYSITRKDFPYVEGDGRHTLEQLIHRHPRYRCQAGTFLARFADDLSRVIPAGERVRLAESGNHCQGTLFRDGADLVTPELLGALDRLALSFAPNGPQVSDGRGGAGGLDMGRFDLRFETEDELRAGRNFGILEINGTTGESTNLYDPAKSLLWSYRVLFGQWRLLYELGAWRRARGAPAWTLWMLLRSLREFYRNRPGSALAD